MSLRDRMGFDAGGMRLEEALAWAIAHHFHYVDFNADRPPNRLDTWDTARLRAVREQCVRHDIQVGLHTLSAVNVAEFSPYVSEAVDTYLRANIDLALRLGCPWMVVHAGYHFSSQIEARQAAALEHLQRAVAYTKQAGVRLLLENLNREPDEAEVHYLGHTVAECRYYFDAIASEHFGWAFTVNHAHLVPEGVTGFLDAFGLRRIGEVRLADNRGDKEEHLTPGQGTIDFPALLQRLEAAGYQQHYMMAFGTQTDLLAGRDYFAACVRGA
jgi:sugar phosphate isomerase/epimerase